MGSVVGCFLTKDGLLYKVIDVWNGDEKEPPQMLVEVISGDEETWFKYVSLEEIKSMEVVRKDALEG